MDERSSVLEDVKESGLLDALLPTYSIVLEEMAKLADSSSGRQVSASPLEIARETVLATQVQAVEFAIEEMVKVGILENTDLMRIVSCPRLDEIAEQLRTGEIGLTRIQSLQSR